MSTTTEVHVGDIGTKFLVTIKENGVALDISTASVKKIRFRRPDNTTLDKTAVFETDGTDGKIYYLSIAGDLSIKGTWSIQGFITMPSGSWNSKIASFMVNENII